MILFKFILHGISDHWSESNENGPPEYNASHLSSLLFSWMNGLIYKGFKQPLLQSELPKNPDQVDVTQVSMLRIFKHLTFTIQCGER